MRKQVSVQDLCRLVYRFKIEIEFITPLKYFTLKYRLNNKYVTQAGLTVFSTLLT